MGPVRRERSRRCVFAALAVLLTATCHGAASAATATRVEVRLDASKLVIAVIAAGPETPDLKALTLKDPPRLIFDISDAVLAPDQPAAIPASAGAIRQIRVAQYQPDTLRIVVDLDGQDIPQWEKTRGKARNEMYIAFPVHRSPLTLERPAVKALDEGAAVRVSGAGALPRRVGTLSNPPRVYVDLTGGVLADPYSRQTFDDGPIREVRTAPQGDGSDPVARIVIELREKLGHSIYCDGSDLVIAVGGQQWALPPEQYRPSGRLKGKRIVVDPGHGGHDVGAPAKPGSPPEGPFEKDIVLDIGARLARLAESEDASVTMTRSDDTFIKLQDRAAVANKLKADTFVSIHCNSCATPDTLCGTSVYYDHPNSIELAKLVQEELIAACATDDKGIRNANFAVIRRTQGPGILVETAFINNEGDRARLTNPNFRERTARAILQGVVRFLSQTPQQDNAEE